MKLQFKEQDFQVRAVKAVMDVFEGQPRKTNKFTLERSKQLIKKAKEVAAGIQTLDFEQELMEDIGYRNSCIKILDSQIEKNIKEVQQNNDIREISAIEKPTGINIGLNLTIEMETGTGKTYTYIRTMYELNKKYGWSKFIVIVPSIAIREGVSRGPWQSDNLSVGPAIPEKIYKITTPGGRKVMPPDGRCWLLTKKRYAEFVADNRIWFGEEGNNVPRIKRFLSEVKTTVTPFTIWKYSEVGHTQEAAQSLKKLFDGKDYFDYPKSVGLIERIVRLYTDKDSIVLDFFSGSATTSEAVTKLNAEEKDGKRKYVQVQLPELTDIKSVAYKDGYKNICEIGKERIRRAAKKIKEETGADIDYGFRVYRLDSSNMQDVYYTPQEYNQGQLEAFADNVKPDRTAEDLLTQVILDWGLPLSLPIEIVEVAGKEVFKVAGNSLYACFDSGVDEAFAKAIAAEQPLRIVFKDASFKDDTAKENVKQLLKQLSPDTEMRVI